VEDAFNSPAVVASIVGGIAVLIGGLVSPWVGSIFKRKEESVSVAERGLSAQLTGWSEYCDRLNDYIKLLQEQNASLQDERAKLWDHNHLQDRALFDCEEKSALQEQRAIAAEERATKSEERIRLLEVRLSEYERKDE
jgi:xanthosine utilization system XapX-like protein